MARRSLTRLEENLFGTFWGFLQVCCRVEDAESKAETQGGTSSLITGRKKPGNQQEQADPNSLEIPAHILNPMLVVTHLHPPLILGPMCIGRLGAGSACCFIAIPCCPVHISRIRGAVEAGFNA